MLFASSVVKPTILAAYVQRHSPNTITPGMDINAIWTAYLQKVGGTGGNANRTDWENAWLDSLGGKGGNIADKWRSDLTSQGYKGNLPEMLRTYFINA